MFFLWPEYLWFLLALALLPAVYVWLLKRRGHAALHYSSIGIVREAVAGRQWRG
ncbi:BatA domain-containing protein, partial [Variovorax sp. WDL1]|uniref:BatA domain-containing protein n=1 Tax=Variovorax sp. WDL1 TaxID=207745 RepID=UPI002FC27F75